MSENGLELGRMVYSQKVKKLMDEDDKFAKFIRESLRKHPSGHWRNLRDFDRDEILYIVRQNHRRSVYVSYKYWDDQKIMIITGENEFFTEIRFLEDREVFTCMSPDGVIYTEW